MSEIDDSDFVNIKITKSKYVGEPYTWMLDITDKNGDEMGGGTAPTFAGIYDMAYSIIVGGDKHSNWEVNEWTQFDANKQ